MQIVTLSTSKQLKQNQTLTHSLRPITLWHQRLKQLNLVCVTFTAKAKNTFSVQEHKGGVLHDAFGRILEQVNPEAFQALWQPEFDAQTYPQFSNQSPPKAFALNPPKDAYRRYQKNQTFRFNLVLFGDTEHYINDCVTTIHQIGQNGLGKQNARYELIDCIAQETLQQSLSLTPNPGRSQQIEIEFASPSYLKQQRKPLTTAPQFPYLLARIIYRANWLSVCQTGRLLINAQERANLLSLAEKTRLVGDETWVQPWNRYSVSRRRWMRFDGLCGRAIYNGIDASILPLLHLAECANIGGKTSFGMGEVRVCLRPDRSQHND